MEIKRRTQMRRKQSGDGRHRISIAVVLLCVAILILLLVLSAAAGPTATTYTPYQDPRLAAGGLPPAKAALLQKEQDAVNAARANAANQGSVQGPVSSSAPISPAPYPSGISDSRDGPSPLEFLVKNAWHGPGGSEGWLAVFAGGARQHPGMDMATSAAVRVMTMNPDPNGPLNLQDVGTFVAPVNASFLTIRSVQGHILNLVTDEGKALTFDTRTNTYG
jgi:hypothetical protein